MNESPKELKRKSSSMSLSAIMMLSALVVLVGPASASEGVADAWGYNWVDSNAPAPTVAFSWIDITSTGTDSGLVGDDQYTPAPVPIGFDFEFYGNTYGSLNFTTNGLVMFGGRSTDYTNDWIPYGSAPNNYAAPFWDDLCVDYAGYNTGAIYYELMGVVPNRQFVIEWFEVSRLGDSDLLSFEVILTETGQIWFQYASLNGELGWGATVGIENADGTIGCQYSYNDDMLSDSLAIMFECGPFGFGPATSTDHGDSGTTVYHTLTIINHQASADSFDMTYMSERGWTVEFLDGALNPLTDTDSSGAPDTGDVASGDSTQVVVAVTIPSSPAYSSDNTTVTAESKLLSPLSRSVSVTTMVDAASLAPPHSDYGTDIEPDGLYDFLTVEASVDVLFSGMFHLMYEVYTPSLGYLVDGSTSVELDPGPAVMYINISGPAIWSRGEDGSWKQDY